MKKKTIIINGTEYIDVSKRENVYAVLGGTAIISGLAFLFVGAIGSVILSLL